MNEKYSYTATGCILYLIVVVVVVIDSVCLFTALQRLRATEDVEQDVKEMTREAESTAMEPKVFKVKICFV